MEGLKKFVIANINREMDDTTYILALATLATCTGRHKLGKAIMQMDDKDIMHEFLEQF
jgi:hypothetical protein